MDKIKYLVLLRGINVGGNNSIRMEELKNLFEELNFTGVRTYIQSGNIIFTDYENDKTRLRNKIEKALLNKLNKKLTIVVLTSHEVDDIINKRPDGFGEGDEYKYDVLYLVEPLKAEEAIKEIKTREGVDKIYEGKKVLYLSRLITGITKSYFSKIIETPLYKDITIRNWNTTKKLYEIMKTKE